MAFALPLMATLASRLLPVVLPLAAKGVSKILPKILRPSMLNSASKVLNYISGNADTIGETIGTGLQIGSDIAKGKRLYYKNNEVGLKDSPQPQQTQPSVEQYEIKSQGAKRLSKILDDILNQSAPFSPRDMQFLQTLNHLKLSRGILNSDLNSILMNAENKKQFKNLHNIITYDSVAND